MVNWYGALLNESSTQKKEQKKAGIRLKEVQLSIILHWILHSWEWAWHIPIYIHMYTSICPFWRFLRWWLWLLWVFLRFAFEHNLMTNLIVPLGLWRRENVYYFIFCHFWRLICGYNKDKYKVTNFSESVACEIYFRYNLDVNYSFKKCFAIEFKNVSIINILYCTNYYYYYYYLHS